MQNQITPLQEGAQGRKPLLVDINDIQRYYLPLSKKRIRAIVNSYLRTVRVGNRILVDREELENFLSDPNRDHIL